MRYYSSMTVNYSPLINKVFNFFKVQQRLNKPSSFDSFSQFTRPFITIAREPGSGGAPIAKMVAEKLDFQLLDDQILDELSANFKRRKAILKRIDEKTRTTVEDLVHSLVNPEYIDDAKFVSEMAKIILSYALKGRVVIVGRGANFITPFAKGLHVSITAPYVTRVQRAMDYEGYNKTKAEQVIAKIEKERKAFVKQYFRKDPTKLNSYDLTLNTCYFPLDRAADLIVDAFRLKFPRPSLKPAVSKPVRAVKKLFSSSSNDQLLFSPS